MGANCVLSTVLLWFPDRRGLASGVLLAGVGLGSLALGVPVTSVIEALGWRAAFACLGIAFALALGVGALAALGAADWLNWMILGTIQGFTQGFSIKMSHEFGAGDYKRLRKTVANSLLLALVTSVVLLLFSQFFARPILELLQTPDLIIEDSLSYLRIMFAGIPVVMAYNILASILRALGDGKTPLYAMVVAAVINVILDLIFVLGFHWGIMGAAGATVIAQLCSGLFCLFAILRVEVLAFSKEDFRMDSSLCMYLMKLGLPMAFQNAIIAVGGMIVQFVVNGFGVLFIAGFTATNKLYGILEVAATSYGYAMVTYVGRIWVRRKLTGSARGCVPR